MFSDTVFDAILKILKTMVEPLIQLCTMSASKLNTIEMAVYMVNCLHQLQSTLSLFEYTDAHLELIKAQVNIVGTVLGLFAVNKRLFLG